MDIRISSWRHNSEGGGWEELRICFPVANNFSEEEGGGTEQSQKGQQQEGKFVGVFSRWKWLQQCC